MKLGATLYVKNSGEAVEFYKEAFGLTLGYHEKYDNGNYFHASLSKYGNEIFCVSEEIDNDDFIACKELVLIDKKRPIMTYGLDFDNEEEVKKAFNMLSESGRILMPLTSVPWTPCGGEVVDKYGVDWYICQLV